MGVVPCIAWVESTPTQAGYGLPLPQAVGAPRLDERVHEHYFLPLRQKYIIVGKNTSPK